MASNTTSTAADMADQSQQNCPLMRLPTELRLRIYKFTFDDIIDDIESDAANKKQLHQEAEGMAAQWFSISRADYPIFVGVLGLLHTSGELRRECLDALWAPAKAFKNVCSDHYKVTAEACRIHVRDRKYSKHFLRVYRLRRMDSNEAWYRLRRMDFIYNAIALVMRNFCLGRSSGA